VTDSLYTPTALDPAIVPILARAEGSVGMAGERLLREELHRILDEGGAAGLATFSQTLLPSLQALVGFLPRLVLNEADPEEAEVMRALGATLQANGTSLDEVIRQGVTLHSRLLHEIAAHLRENDRVLVTAVGQLSRALLQVAHNALLAYYDSATESLRQLARTDGMTGVANRHYFEERFSEELLRAQRTNRSLALILIDLDRLKTVNDTFGHAVGDQLLRSMAAVLRAQSRGIDIAARIGGDEFALLLAETDREGAAILLDRLRASAAEQDVSGLAPTFSAGVAVYPEDGRTVVGLMEYADTMLYRAKRNQQS
jgi:diguanylate cyclase (GGDEF)-like protein